MCKKMIALALTLGILAAIIPGVALAGNGTNPNSATETDRNARQMMAY